VEGAGYAGGIISAAIDGEKCCHDWRSLNKKNRNNILIRIDV
jgi:uncharacterized FAD-dependent dehydrogenase